MRPNRVYTENVSKYIAIIFYHIPPDLSSMIILPFDIA
jgi:hypothetical protein